MGIRGIGTMKYCSWWWTMKTGSMSDEFEEDEEEWEEWEEEED